MSEKQNNGISYPGWMSQSDTLGGQVLLDGGKFFNVRTPTPHHLVYVLVVRSESHIITNLALRLKNIFKFIRHTKIVNNLKTNLKKVMVKITDLLFLLEGLESLLGHQRP